MYALLLLLCTPAAGVRRPMCGRLPPRTDRSGIDHDLPVDRLAPRLLLLLWEVVQDVLHAQIKSRKHVVLCVLHVSSRICGSHPPPAI